MLQERDSAVIGGAAASGHAAITVGRVAHRLDRLARRLRIGHVRHLDALHPHVEEAQNEGRVEPRGAHDRGDADALGRHHAGLHVVQV